MKFFFIFYLIELQLSYQVDPNWYLIKEITIPSNKIFLISISVISKNYEFKVIDNNDYSTHYKSLFNRDGDEYILFPKSDIDIQYKVYIKLSEGIRNIEHELKIIELYDEDSIRFYKAITDISKQHYSQSIKEKVLSLNVLDSLLLKNYSDQQKNKLIYLKFIILYDLAHFREIINVENNLILDNVEDYDIFIHIEWIKSLSFLNLGEFNKAILSFENTLKVLNNKVETNREWRINKAEIQAYLGLALSLNYYHRQIKINDGFDKINIALNSAYQLKDNQLISEILYLLGSYYSAKQDWLQTLATLDIALEYVKKANTSDNLVGIYNQKAIAHRQLRQLNHSLYFFRKSIARIPEEDKSTKANIYNNIASIYEFLGDLQKAKRYFNSSHEQFILMKSKYGESMVLKSLGRVYRKMNNISKAIESHTKSINYFKDNKELGFLEVNVELAKDYYDQQNYQIAQIIAIKVLLTSKYKELNKKTRLLLNFKQDSNLFSRFENLSEFNLKFLKKQFFLNNLILTNEYELRALLIIANTEIYESNYDSFNYFNREFESGISKKLMPIYDQLDWNILKINFLKKKHDTEAVSNTLQNAIKLVNNTRAQFDVSDLALHWTHQAQSILNKYIKIVAEQEKYQEIFELLEKYYAINLREKRFNQTDVLITRKSEEFQQALDDYVRLEREVLLTEDDNKQRQADEAKEHFLALSDEDEPEPETQKIELKYLNIEEVQSQLRVGQLLLRYYVSDDNAFVFVIDQQQWQVMKIPNMSELKPKIQQLIGSINSKDFKSLVKNLLAAEIMPIERITQGNYEKLIIIADGITNLIPFSMLNIGQNDKYLPLTTAIDVERTYSASDYFTEIPESDHDKHSISIFANPVFLKDIDDQNIDAKIGTNNRLRTFTALPSTARDVENITTVFKDFKINVFTQKNATNANFLSETNRSANIIHIGTHGFFNDKGLDNVGLATSIIDENNKRAPGVLAMREILYQPFKANLAVVSGCETTRGMEINGEGFNSLTRGLLSQGVNTVIGTIWSIPDRATSVFMKEFYLNLSDKNGNVSQALNTTKRAFTTQPEFRRYRHPYYWAGFVLTSSNQNISRNIFQ